MKEVTVSCYKELSQHLVEENLSLYLSIPLHALFLDLGRFLSFLIIYTDGMAPWPGDQPVARPLPTHRTTQTQ
jgi:hypothetical protein